MVQQLHGKKGRESFRINAWLGWNWQEFEPRDSKVYPLLTQPQHSKGSLLRGWVTPRVTWGEGKQEENPLFVLVLPIKQNSLKP